MSSISARFGAALAAAAIGLTVVAVAPAQATSPARSKTKVTEPDREILLRSARENAELDQASLPLRTLRVKGSGNSPASYVVTESSDRKDAARRRVTYSPKLANARGTGAVQKGYFSGGVLVVPAGVDFSPTRVLEPGPAGFPPVRAEPGAIGEQGYSPLVELPDGTVINAPQVANQTGRADKLLAVKDGRAYFQETKGFYEGEDVYYVSFDASAPDIAALENVTYAPALNEAPGLGSNKKDSARSGIAPFVNGRTGTDNPERQGLNSALLGEGDPLNVVQTLAGDKDYSPLWDVHASVWTDRAKTAGADLRQDDFDRIERLAEDGLISGPEGATWGAIGAIVNCPIISVVSD